MSDRIQTEVQIEIALERPPTTNPPAPRSAFVPCGRQPTCHPRPLPGGVQRALLATKRGSTLHSLSVKLRTQLNMASPSRTWQLHGVGAGAAEPQGGRGLKRRLQAVPRPQPAAGSKGSVGQAAAA